MGRRTSVLSVLASLLATMPLVRGEGSVTTGRVTFDWSNFGALFGPYEESNAGRARLRIDIGADDVDHLDQHWFHYRIEGGDRETALPPPAAESYQDDPGRFELTWDVTSGLPFTARLTGLVSEPEDADARLDETLEITNSGDCTLVMTLFVYTDVDVRDVFGGFSDTATSSAPDRLRIDDHGTFDFVEIGSDGADAFEVDSFPHLRDFQLVDAGPDDLTDSGLPFGPENFTGAFAHHLELAPGEVAQLPVAIVVNGSLPESTTVPRTSHGGLTALAASGLAHALDALEGVSEVLGPTGWDSIHAAASAADGTLYAVGRFSLIALDRDGGFATHVARLDVDDVRGMSFAPDGALHAVHRDPDEGDRLVAIDVATGEQQPLATLDIPGLEALAYAVDGTLYGWHDGPKQDGLGLVTVDPTTGGVVAVAPGAGETAEVRGLTFDEDGTLHGARHALVRIDPTTGAATPVGSGGYFDLGALTVGRFRLALSGPEPGLAGEQNVFVVSGAPPGAEVTLLLGTISGARPVPGCAAVSLGMSDPIALDRGVADADGTVRFARAVPATAAGRAVLFQAVETVGCRTSATEAFTFPD